VEQWLRHCATNRKVAGSKEKNKKMRKRKKRKKRKQKREKKEKNISMVSLEFFIDIILPAAL
jgi:hypothetical protein